jgi:hypothetical protein
VEGLGPNDQSIFTVRWTPPVTGSVDTYVVEVGSAMGLRDIGRLIVGSGQVTVSHPVERGTRVFVRVRAQNACGESSPSNEVLVVR